MEGCKIALQNYVFTFFITMFLIRLYVFPYYNAHKCWILQHLLTTPHHTTPHLLTTIHPPLPPSCLSCLLLLGLGCFKCWVLQHPGLCVGAFAREVGARFVDELGGIQRNRYWGKEWWMMKNERWQSYRCAFSTKHPVNTPSLYAFSQLPYQPTLSLCLLNKPTLSFIPPSLLYHPLSLSPLS